MLEALTGCLDGEESWMTRRGVVEDSWRTRGRGDGRRLGPRDGEIVQKPEKVNLRERGRSSRSLREKIKRMDSAEDCRSPRGF